ncbi:putative ABC transporter permease protein NosY [Roseobacter fucihabitans]|uniref:ABC transporter permease protein NosY n=1 Tax=Roseobacter fucihabitans TaxID=1537242 RepID=A0ABZ2BPH5_9RHOB|nr:ABC transporter permease subunit [Roseobacter litoralis]MBC6963473.1 ABC-2 family transporter protein [Roseobacter litoralis]
MSQIIALASVEFRILQRNRWLIIATGLLSVFALALTLAGATTSGALGVDLLTVSVASMTTLAVYLVPLVALLISFETIAGDAERGSLALVLTYPVSRGALLAGKFLAHLAALAIAVCIGFGLSGLISLALGGAGPASGIALLRLMLGAILLGAAFIALGYVVSSLSRSVAAAAGGAGFVWLVLVVLYDLVLLALVVWDNGGVFSREIFPWALLANPADALRLFAVTGSADQALVTGMGAAAAALPAQGALLSLLFWPVAGLLLARVVFGRRVP